MSALLDFIRTVFPPIFQALLSFFIPRLMTDVLKCLNKRIRMRKKKMKGDDESHDFNESVHKK